MRTNLFSIPDSKLIRFSSEGLSKQRTYRLPDADSQLAGDVLSSTSETNLTGILVGNGSVISAITTSASIANILSDETGSGALVFANTPTLVTPVIGTASSTRILNADGTTALPSYSFTSDPNTGIIARAAIITDPVGTVIAKELDVPETAWVTLNDLIDNNP